ncbi:L-rhamnose mutarotase [Mariniflexile fucanivorans]|uniref:L-rhamnose mutarotase n=1 Tax=Mariniflexile fucanivorans TaxID=264023 RepID=A0A4R1RJD9_9FLAO|nr:L-rhamnose mutarotase [Mariniflexile fucanivorans]TCL66261.1 L-rhamnose mutarotase [Mariniflexile fucanivorans]
MKRYCFALDLKNDQNLINEYAGYHKNVWPEILESIKDSGIMDAEIYLVQDRLFMIVEAKDSFSLEKKGEMDSKNETVQKWETLMWDYQKALPNSKPGEKWKLMDCIFKL